MARILVVEDDDAIREAVSYNLRQDGHDLLTAADGVAALDLARADRPDLIVLDVMLPRMSGLDVCRILRDEGHSMPVLMLTARSGEADRVQGLDIGADDYVPKPFSMRELRARVASLLRRDRLSRAAGQEEHALAEPGRRVLTGGPIELDLDRHEARLDGKPVALRPREFELLEYLMRHPGQALTREMILEAVWDYFYGGETRTVDVHIRWLREKLEPDPAHPRHIQTIRGVGYRFTP
jgi:DNA-binding response OmpR family regulator